MGVVWRARDQLLDRDVAVKEVVISALLGADERRNAYQRTLREARTAARLSHRGVVAVYDVAEEDGRPWIIMELVPSRSLDQVLSAERQLAPLRCGRIGEQLLSALAAAHLAGVLHRDVKPSNVLIATDRSGGGGDERAVLTDFGIAQFEGDPRLTQTGMVMGSPGFTAPERIRGGDATPASDLWSLGATLYAAVEGRGPYEKRGGAITTMSAIINEDAPVAAHAGPLGPVIAALMRREPSARPSASTAARMFAHVLPQLATGTDRPHEATHPVTIHSEPARQPPAPAPAPPAAVAVVAAVGDAAVGDAAVGDADAPDADAAALPAESAVGASAPGAEPVAEPEPEHADDASDSKPETPSASASAWGSQWKSEWESKAEAEEPVAEPAPAPESESAAAADPAAAVPVAGAAVIAAAEAPGDLQAAGGPELAGHPAEAGAGNATAVLPLDPAPGSGTGETVIDRQPAGETVIDRGPAGYQPTEVSIPVPKPARGLPTFTASQSRERAVPTFSATRQDRSGAAPAPFAGSIGQYAGPSQPQADLAGQYPPGKGGGRAQRRRRPLRWLVLVIGAVVLAAAIGAGAAYALGHHGSSTAATKPGANGPGTVSVPQQNFGSVDALNHPSAAVPPGSTPERVTAAQAHSSAGFTIDLPPGWKERRKGLATIFTAPGDLFLEIDLTPHKYPNMVDEAHYIEGRASPAFSSYRLRYLQAVPVRSTAGAIWQFDRTLDGVLVIADDILFIKPTPAGSQSYAVFIRAPGNGWGRTYLPAFEKILSTFQTLPAS